MPEEFQGQKLETLETQRTEFLIRDNYYEYLSTYINKNDLLDLVIAPSSVGIQDGVLSALISQMIDIQLQVRMFSVTNKLENPLISENTKKLIELKRSITEAVRNLRATEKIKNSYLEKQIATTERQLNFLPSSQRKFISIRRTNSLLENLFVYFVQQYP